MSEFKFLDGFWIPNREVFLIFFAYRLTEIFPNLNMDKLDEQFLNSQLLATESQRSQKKAWLEENDHYHLDDLWAVLME